MKALCAALLLLAGYAFADAVPTGTVNYHVNGIFDLDSVQTSGDPALPPVPIANANFTIDFDLPQTVPISAPQTSTFHSATFVIDGITYTSQARFASCSDNSLMFFTGDTVFAPDSPLAIGFFNLLLAGNGVCTSDGTTYTLAPPSGFATGVLTIGPLVRYSTTTIPFLDPPSPVPELNIGLSLLLGAFTLWCLALFPSRRFCRRKLLRN